MLDAIELKSAPDLKRVVTAAFPGYKKHRAYVSVFNGGVNINSYWDGGSRDEYAIVELETLQRRALPTSSHPYFDVARKGLVDVETAAISVNHIGGVTLKILPEGYALVAAGTFCGKPATAHVYLNAANMPKYLKA